MSWSEGEYYTQREYEKCTECGKCVDWFIEYDKNDEDGIITEGEILCYRCYNKREKSRKKDIETIDE